MRSATVKRGFLPSFSSMATTTRSASRLAKPFGEQIIGGDREEEGKAREERHPPGLLDVGGRGRKDSSPRGRGAGQPHAEEGQRRLGQDGPPHAERGGDQERCERVGQHMPDEDARGRSAGGPGGACVVEVPGLQHLGPSVARIRRPAGQPDRQHDRRGRRRKKGGQGEEEKEDGKTEHDLDDAGKDEVRRASNVTGDASHREADEERDGGGRQPDRQRDRGRRDDAREQVAAQVVRAEEMGRGGCEQALLQPDLPGRAPGQRREGRHDPEGGDDGQGGPAAARKAAQESSLKGTLRAQGPVPSCTRGSATA